jgi:YidC/Oxa1 family membrane protein insertase
MTDPTIWNQLFIWPITNLLVFFYKLAELLHLPGPLGFSIILMTILFRIMLFPLISTQMKSAKKIAKLKPHLDELQKRHKSDRQALQQAQMALYKEHGVNPAAGCLPLLIQMPVLIALYNVFYSVFSNNDLSKIVSEINQILYTPQLHLSTIDLNFFGVNLAIKPSQWQSAGWWLLTIPVATGLLQWYQTKLMMPNHQSTVKHQPPEKKENDKKEEKSQEDMAMEMQKQMAIIAPLMFGFFAYQFPIGLALYWNLFGIFGIMQQQYINKTHG